MACPGSDDEDIFSQRGDERQPVSSEELKRPPYQQILRVEASKTCCKGMERRQGTCFLVKTTEEEGNNEDRLAHYLCAAHVLFCPIHGKFAKEITLFATKSGKEQTSIQEISHGRPHAPGEQGWYRICDRYLETYNDAHERRNHDYAVVAIYYDDVPGRLVKQANAFRVEDAQLPNNIANVTIAGYPSAVTHGQRTFTCNVEMFKHYGRIDLVRTYRNFHVKLWKHRIDTSGGQSGAPVFIDDTSTGGKKVVGLHVGCGNLSGRNESDLNYNFAVVVDVALLEEILRWPKGFQVNPEHDEAGDLPEASSWKAWHDLYDAQPLWRTVCRKLPPGSDENRDVASGSSQATTEPIKESIRPVGLLATEVDGMQLAPGDRLVSRHHREENRDHHENTQAHVNRDVSTAGVGAEEHPAQGGDQRIGGVTTQAKTQQTIPDGKKVNWMGLLNAVSQEVTSIPDCNTLATQLGLMRDDNRRYRPVTRLAVENQNNPMAVANGLFLMWLDQTRSMPDGERLQKLRQILFDLVPMPLQPLGSAMNDLLPIYLIPKS